MCTEHNVLSLSSIPSVESCKDYGKSCRNTAFTLLDFGLSAAQEGCHRSVDPKVGKAPLIFASLGKTQARLTISNQGSQHPFP